MVLKIGSNYDYQNITYLYGMTGTQQTKESISLSDIERIHTAAREKGIMHWFIAKSIGIHHHSLYNIYSGTRPLTNEVRDKIFDLLGIEEGN